MSVTLEPGDVSGMAVEGEQSPDSEPVAATFEELLGEVVATFEGTAEFDGFRWDGDPGSPYVGPRDPTASEYVWLGLSHETYRSLRRPSRGLQVEFGLDLDAASGFFDRAVLCGLYLGPWADEPETGEIAGRLRSESETVASFLEERAEYVLATGDAVFDAPDPGTLEARADELVEGFAITRDLDPDALFECEDLTELVVASVRDVLGLYGALAGVPELREAWPADGDDHDVEPTVDSIAAFSSILDESDVRDSVEPVVDRGASRAEALEHVRRYAVDMEREAGLYAVAGLGPTTGYVLAQNGITTRQELAETTLADLDDVGGLSRGRLEQVLESVGDRAAESSSDATESVESDSGDSAIRSAGEDGSEPPAEPTGRPGETSSVDGLPVEHVDGRRVEANPLSEYYEALLGMREVLSTVMQLRGTDLAPDDLTDPRVQYLAVLDAVGGSGLAQLDVPGYGAQHRDRLAFSMTDYRTAFGDGDRVTEFHGIEFEPYHEETRAWLAETTALDAPDRYVRPVPPGGDRPLPEVVETVDDLRHALGVLGEFPAYPPLPDEPGAADRTLPVAELYADLFGDDPETRLLDPGSISGPGQRTDEPVEGPVAEATPTSGDEVESFLLDYGKLTHLFQRVEPPDGAPVQRPLPVFGLDWYRPESESFDALAGLAKRGDDEPVSAFRPRLRDMVHRRFLRDRWTYDYVTVVPGHEEGSLNPRLVELARDAVVETAIVYAPLLERTETVERQREKSRGDRAAVAERPGESLRASSALDDATVVLFDDVCTTGSSLLAGAHLLREAGASRVVGLTLGVTPGESGSDVREITTPDAVASDVVAGVE